MNPGFTHKGFLNGGDCEQSFFVFEIKL
jgi:hypothetical protein